MVARAGALPGVMERGDAFCGPAATTATDEGSEPATIAPAPGDAAVPAPETDNQVAADPPPEPSPILVEKSAEIAPIAPSTPDPFPDSPNANIPAAAASATPAQPDGEQAAAKPARKRAPKKKPAPPEPASDMDEPQQASDTDSAESFLSGVVERVITSDGATRLVVTAYIGIGNRLFIRGEGPGLSWEKGVPLQFVSIGKWRWETNDAFTPVKFKLFKNDELECSALGAQSLDPGHQQEVTAAF